MMMKTPTFGEKILVSLVTALQKQLLLYINCCCNNVKRNTDEMMNSPLLVFFGNILVSLVTAPQKQWLYFTSTVAVKMSKGILMKMVKLLLCLSDSRRVQLVKSSLPFGNSRNH